MRNSTKDRMQGAVRQAKGSVKQETGRITRKRKLQVKGLVEKNVGKAQRALGREERKQEKTRR